jgi:hypothetical protein
MKTTSCQFIISLVAVGFANLLGGSLPSLPGAPVAAQEKRPPFATVQKIVIAQLHARPDYKQGDIITADEVKPVFEVLEKLGWKVEDQADILKQMLGPSDFLVKTLRSPAGERFMRKISADPSVYDRLDRVSQHKRGPATIRNLLRLPNGEQYTRARPGPGQPTLSDLVLIYDRGSVHDRAVKDFDKPTGKIYTGKQFLQRLKRSYVEADRPEPPMRPASSTQ